MIAGCLGLFILIAIVGAIGSYFGGEWAVVATAVLIGLGFWADREEKKKQKQEQANSNELLETSPQIIQQTKPSKKAQNKTNKETIQFWYTDFEGNLTHRTVDVKKLDSEYLEAYCHDREDMRTFRVERIDDEIIDLSTGEILTKTDWLANHSIYEVIKYRNKKSDFDFDDEDDFDNEYTIDEEICFTGFKKADRERLETIAAENGFSVKKSVTKNLSYLVYGSNAGPAKLAQAEEVAACIIDEATFLEIVGENE